MEPFFLGKRIKTNPIPLDITGILRLVFIKSYGHTSASLMISGGADVARVSGLLGHSQVSTTLDIYTHAFDDKKKAVSAVLQKSLDI